MAGYDAGFCQTDSSSFRVVMDVGEWDNSRAMNAPGQSGTHVLPTTSTRCSRGPEASCSRSATAVRPWTRMPGGPCAWSRPGRRRPSGIEAFHPCLTARQPTIIYDVRLLPSL
jgi:hypothetical protein